MSVFFLNTCKFKGCGLTFSTLQELIYHIEDTHLEFEPKNAEIEFKQNNNCMPVSCIFRLFSGEYTSSQSPIKPKSMQLNNLRKDSEGEIDEENYESESEKSIDSWSNNSIESESNTVLKMINPPKITKSQDDSEKPYVCQFVNCKKRYRNSNGLKYHIKSVHTDSDVKKEPTTPRMYRCHCNKNYKTFYGLKNHAKSCNVNLTNPNPIDNHHKLIDLKNTVGLAATICTPTNTSSLSNQTNKVSSPTMSVSIATTPSTNLSPASTNSELTNQMQEDDSIEENSLSKQIFSLKTPTLQQHLLSPIETKSSAFTSQA